MIKIDNISYNYAQQDDVGVKENEISALNNVSLNIQQGEFVAILGHNGSGKSTLAKMINGLLIPTKGNVFFEGMSTSNEKNIISIRQNCGMVFQNPDNQIIASIVEEDVAFGPENLNIPTEEIKARVEESLKKVGMYEFRNFSPNKLSGGQKQRVAIAGVLAMKPKCIILDEPTAMLDPRGRKEVIDTILKLNKEDGVTIILITHYMSEAMLADRILIMNNGSVVIEGSPNEVFDYSQEIESLGLELPIIMQLAGELKNEGIDIDIVFDEDELIESILRLK